MPMSLRVSPQKKERFEQESHRPVKRIKSGHSSPLASVSTPHQSTNLFPRLQIDSNLKYTEWSDDSVGPKYTTNVSTPADNASLAKPSMVPSSSNVLPLHQRVDTSQILEDPQQQALWLVDTIRDISQNPYKASLDFALQSTFYNNSAPPIESQIGAVERVLTNRYWKSGRKRGFKRGSPFKPTMERTLPPVPLPEHIGQVLFQDASESQKMFGNFILHCLRSGTSRWNRESAGALWRSIQDSHSRVAFSVALDAIANNTEVLHGLHQSIQGLQQRSNDIEVTPHLSEVPSLATDSDNADNPVSLPSEGSSPRDGTYSTTINPEPIHLQDQQITASHRNHVTNPLPNILQKTGNLALDLLRDACATMIEMANGHPNPAIGEASDAQRTGFNFDLEPDIGNVERPNVDQKVCGVIRGIITELQTYADHLHGIASLRLEVAQYQYVNRERFINCLQKLLDRAPPTINCFLNSEQAEVTSIFYQQIQNRLSRPRVQIPRAVSQPTLYENSQVVPTTSPQSVSNASQHPQEPFSPTSMLLHTQNGTQKQVPAHATLPSNAPPLRQLVPKSTHSKRKRRLSSGLKRGSV